jgi:hypothetical protein
MYYYLVSSLKRRLIYELKDSFGRHPLYSKLVPFIQNKYAFEERPQFGIVVKGSSANKVSLSGDNFLGTVQSHVMLAHVGQPVFPLEWVREDLRAVQANNDIFPTLPGVYYIEILSVPTNPSEFGTFVVDPLLTSTDEAVLRFQSGIEREGQLQQKPVQGTLRMWENRRFQLREGIDYRVDYSDGAIEFLNRFPPNSVVTADYRYAIPSLGPVQFQWNTPDVKTLPGVVLAFGKRASVGDKVAIVVYPDRVDTANAFGGKFEASFDLDVIVANDATQMEEVVDLVIMYLWGQKKGQLELEGIEIVDISIGGEAEDVYDETADIYYYNASVSVQLRADWEIHVPLPLTISRVTPTTKDMDQSATLGGKGSPTSIVGEGPTSLYFATVPVLAGRNNNFERIG